MSVEENKVIARRFNDELWNKHNLDIIDELMADNLVGHPGMRSREEFKQGTEQSLSLWPDVTISIEQMIAEGDMVAYIWTMVATHTQEVMGVAPTGKKGKHVGISMYRIANGKIVEDWSQSDSLGFHKWLGITPDMGNVQESTWD